MAEYTRYKTVRFTEDAFQLVEIGAREDGVTTSEYIRNSVMEAVAKINLEEALSPEAA
jgi:hypothetical protein